MTVPSHCLVLGQRSDAVVGKRHPRELEVADRVVEARQAVVDPRPDVENGRVLAVGPGEHERPVLGLVVGGPKIRELAQRARRLVGSIVPSDFADHRSTNVAASATAASSRSFIASSLGASGVGSQRIPWAPDSAVVTGPEPIGRTPAGSTS